jgi:putative alpha-1,2-mannosidase
MRIEIEQGTLEYWYLWSAIGFYYPRIVANTLGAHSKV